jgi:ankyrin repeat protein
MKNFPSIWDSITFASGEKELFLYLSRGGDMYCEDDFHGWSLLHFASNIFNREIIDLLLKFGFDVNYVSSCGYPAVFAALEYDVDAALQANTEPDFETVKYLVERGASLEIKHKNGTSLLDYCELVGGGVLFRGIFKDMFYSGSRGSK